MTEDNNLSKGAPFPGGDTTLGAATSGMARSFLPGDILDNTYQLTAMLGRGGMGIVFACHHVVLDKPYAIKLLAADQLSEEHWTRFRAEAQALAKINHPGIVGIHNMGTVGGQFPYYVMDLLRGESLGQLISREGRLPIDQALDIFIQVADALGAAHLHGIIHRDVNPSNMMLLSDRQNQSCTLKIVDFGIARLSKHGFDAQSQTKTGLVFGTPFYMSPEQCQGLRADERSDIYSLGCALFETLTGDPPFCGDNSFHTFMMHQTEPVPSLASVVPDGKFPQALELAVAKMLAKSATERYQTMAQIKQDLERIRAGKTIMAQAVSSRFNLVEEPVKTSSAPEDLPVEEGGMPGFMRTLMAAAAILLLAGAGYGLYLSLAPHASTPNLGQGKPGSKAFEDENLADAFIFENIREESRLLQQRLKVYRAQPALANAPIKQNNPPGFLFPKDFIIGDLQFGDDTPVQATGFVPCPPDKHVCLYLSKFADEWPELLTKFGDDDLNGLELRTENTAAVIKTVSAWHKLDQLSFFNPLLKAVMNDGRDHKTPKDQDNEASCDESKITDEHLIALDRLSNLKSLGLCGIHVTGEAIVKMHLLNTLTALKLKRVSNIQKLLDVLPGKDNLRELWLVGQDTTDAQVEALTKMKNLETLRIRRCKLTPESLKAFKKMPALKHLYLDRPWTADVTEQFTNELPSYQYEPLTDRTYWKFAPDEKK